MKSVIAYLQAGRGRPFEAEEIAVWTDQMARSGHSEDVLQEAARRYVGRAGYFVVAEFLQVARDIATDRAMRERIAEHLRIGDGAERMSPEELKAFMAELRNRMGWKAKDPAP